MHTDPLAAYLAEYQRQGMRLAHLPWLASARSEAISRLKETGLPHSGNHHWAYADLWNFSQHDFILPDANLAAPAPIDSTHDATLHTTLNLNAHRVVIENGAWRSDIATSAFPDDCTICPLSRLPARHVDTIRHCLSLHDDTPPFALLNTALTENGFFIHIAKNRKLSQPIHLVFLSQATKTTKPKTATSNHPGVFIQMEAGAEASVIEHYVGFGDATYFANTRVDCSIAPAAQLHHYRLFEEGEQAYHVGNVSARVAANGMYFLHQHVLSGGFVRNEIRVDLNEPHAQFSFWGGYYGCQKQYIDHQLQVSHCASATKSAQHMRGVLSDYARGVFSSKVTVHEGTEEVRASQKNANLMLSPHAEANAKPELEIYTDNVECSHASTLTEPDADMLFYLRSRGVAASDAHAMLVFGFLQEFFLEADAALQPWLIEKYASKMGMQPWHADLGFLGAPLSPPDIPRKFV